MTSMSRPVRNRNQPARNKDKIQLNLELIQRLEASKTFKPQIQNNTNYAKLLSNLINSANNKYRTFLAKSQSKREIAESANSKKEEPEQKQKDFAKSNDRRRYFNGEDGYKRGRRTENGVEMAMEKNVGKQQSKTGRNSKSLSAQESEQNRQGKPLTGKQSKKAANDQTYSIIKKPFRRSSYHIGIAYSIYMAQIREKNPNIKDPKECDPTYNARRLKEAGSL